jgi:gluconate 5-dehydrogenase
MSDHLGGMFDIAGRSAIVTGAYGDLGAAIARALVARGVRVAVAGRDPAKLDQLANELGNAALPVALDAASVDSIRAAVTVVAKAFDRIDFLVNSVGIFEEQTLLDATPESFDRVTSVNYRSAMFLAQAVARVQVERATQGRHVHLLSVRAQLAMPHRGYSSYCGSKGGMAMLVRQHAAELGPHGVRSFSVDPAASKFRMVRIDGAYGAPDWQVDASAAEAACAVLIQRVNEL